MPFLPSPSPGDLPHSLLPLVYACDALSKYIYRDGNVYVFERNVNVFPLINAAGVSSINRKSALTSVQRTFRSTKTTSYCFFVCGLIQFIGVCCLQLLPFLPISIAQSPQTVSTLLVYLCLSY